MAVKSAKLGTVAWGGTPTLVSDVTDIAVNETVDPNPYASSSTSGERRRVPGISDISGQFTCLQDAIPVGIAPGTTVALVIKSDGSVTMFSDSAYIEGVAYRVPVGGGGTIEAVVTWSRNG